MDAFLLSKFLLPNFGTHDRLREVGDQVTARAMMQLKVKHNIIYSSK
jgi:hypothetical protein